MTSKCAVDDCSKPGVHTVYCPMHYRRFRLYGDPNVVLKKQRRKNEYSKIIIKDDHALVELTRGFWATIDIEDVAIVSNKKWNCSSSTGYAYDSNSESMHQMIMWPVPQGKIIDHKDRLKLNNRRANLHFVSLLDNNVNRADVINSPGISFHILSGKYQIWLTVDGVPLYGGLYDSRDKAIAARIELKELAETVPVYRELKKAWKLMRTAKQDTEKRDE